MIRGLIIEQTFLGRCFFNPPHFLSWLCVFTPPFFRDWLPLKQAFLRALNQSTICPVSHILLRWLSIEQRPIVALLWFHLHTLLFDQLEEIPHPFGIEWIWRGRLDTLRELLVLKFLFASYIESFEQPSVHTIDLPCLSILSVSLQDLVDFAEREDSHERILRFQVLHDLLVVAVLGVVLALDQLLSLELE